MNNRVRTLIATVLKVDAADMPEHPSAESLKIWDSLRHMMLMMALEREFKIRIEPEVAPSLTSAAAIEEFISEHSIDEEANG